MIHRGLRTAPFLVIFILVVASTALAFPPDQRWVYEAIDRLKTLGIMPLWVGTIRPIPSVQLRAGLEEAIRRSQSRNLSPYDVALLERLQRVVDSHVSFHASTGPTRFTITRPSATMSGEFPKFEWLVSTSFDPFNAAGIFFESRGVGLFLGRSPMGWGPGGDGGLLFADSMPGVDRVQMFLEWRNTRFTKMVGLLDGGRSIVATRLDIPFRPNIRISFSESIIIAGAPYWGYVANPMPLLVSQYIEQHARPSAGDNQIETADGEWVIRPGLRLFAELAVDDFTVPTPTLNYPHRLGFTVGMHRAFDTGADFVVQYTLVTNWTYTQEPANHILRGLPMAHPIGTDFDVVHIRWNRSQSQPILWGSFIRKGEGQLGIDMAATTDVEARRDWFLKGVVEYSLVTGADVRFGSPEGWSGTFGPWVAYRANAGHVQGAARIDWGLSLGAGRTF